MKNIKTLLKIDNTNSKLQLYNNLRNEYISSSKRCISSITLDMRNNPKNSIKRKNTFLISNKSRNNINNIYDITSKNRLNTKNKNISDVKINKFKSICDDINFDEYLSKDLDDLDFDDAYKLDTRGFCEIFVERLKSKLIFIDTFYSQEKIRPLTIRIALLLLNIDLYFVINGICYGEEYISERFYDDTKETFFSFLPRNISHFFYAEIVGNIISIFIGCIFLEENKIKKTFIREKNNAIQLKYEMSLIVSSTKKRNYSFMLICIFAGIISWYYVTCFNNVYPKMSIEWIKTSITIIIIEEILSFIISFLEVELRLMSFKCKSEKIYKVSKFLA